jgi:hypothetical protein
MERLGLREEALVSDLSKRRLTGTGHPARLPECAE